MLSSEHLYLFHEIEGNSNALSQKSLNDFVLPLSQDGMTVLHLAAKFGHVDVLEVLRGKVPWSMASVKVKTTTTL